MTNYKSFVTLIKRLKKHKMAISVTVVLVLVLGWWVWLNLLFAYTNKTATEELTKANAALRSDLKAGLERCKDNQNR